MQFVLRSVPADRACETGSSLPSAIGNYESSSPRAVVLSCNAPFESALAAVSSLHASRVTAERPAVAVPASFSSSSPFLHRQERFVEVAPPISLSNSVLLGSFRDHVHERPPGSRRLLDPNGLAGRARAAIPLVELDVQHGQVLPIGAQPDLGHDVAVAQLISVARDGRPHGVVRVGAAGGAGRGRRDHPLAGAGFPAEHHHRGRRVLEPHVQGALEEGGEAEGKGERQA